MNNIAKKTRFILLFILMLGSIAIACNTSAQPQYVVVTTTPISAIMEAPDGKIGNEVSANDFKLTVISVEEATSFGDDIPKTGNKYVAVEVEIESRKDNYDVNPIYARLQDSNGNVYALVFVGKDPYLEPSYGISKGTRVKGWITYEVSEAAKEFLFIYEPWMSTEKVIISLQ